jgi:SAM-dependent methyltransferase
MYSLRAMTDFLAQQLEQMAPHRAILRAVECKWMSRLELERPVLDVGCGDGHFAEVCYRGRAIDFGLDPMERDLAEARSRRGVYRHLLRSNATDLPFADGTFATVVSNSVLEHIPDVDRAIDEIGRVLRRPDRERGLSGGVLAITTPSDHFGELLLGSTMCRRFGLTRLGKAYAGFLNRLSHHFHVDAPEVWKRRFDAANIAVEECFYYFSAAAHRRFDLCHYLGVPNLISKRLFGRWVLFSGQMAPFERWLRPWYEEPLPAIGAYQFIRGRRR